MANRFVNTMKYGLLAVIAFFGPKIITDSGHYLSNVEKELESDHEIHLDLGVKPADIDKINTKDYLEEASSGKKKNTVTVSYPQTAAPSQKTQKYGNRIGWESEEVRNESEIRSSTSLVYGTLKSTPLEEILRFDRTPSWIVDHWSRVDTVLSSPPWRGYRVMVLTGSAKDDLAGVLTWYYDHREMKRIEFSGQTGDIQKILSFLSRRYGMVLNSESTATHYIYESSFVSMNGQQEKKSRMDIYPAKTFIASRPNEHFDIRFTLERPE